MNNKVDRATFTERIRLQFAIYCDEKSMTKDERQELAREISAELEWETDVYNA